MSCFFFFAPTLKQYALCKIIPSLLPGATTNILLVFTKVTKSINTHYVAMFFLIYANSHLRQYYSLIEQWGMKKGKGIILMAILAIFLMLTMAKGAPWRKITVFTLTLK